MDLSHRLLGSQVVNWHRTNAFVSRAYSWCKRTGSCSSRREIRGIVTYPLTQVALLSARTDCTLKDCDSIRSNLLLIATVLHSDWPGITKKKKASWGQHAWNFTSWLGPWHISVCSETQRKERMLARSSANFVFSPNKTFHNVQVIGLNLCGLIALARWRPVQQKQRERTVLELRVAHVPGIGLFPTELPLIRSSHQTRVFLEKVP